MNPSNTSFNPFPGLRPFRTDEDYLFFGREGQSEEILRRLRLNRFLAVVGISGSGKSSLIRAGLLPYVYGGFMPGASSHWRMAIFRPGNDPIGNLARALGDEAVLGEAGSGETDARKNEMLLEITLQRSGLGLIEAVRLARLPKDENLLIVVDQFEELFRYGKADRALRQQDDAAAFVKLLFEASQQTALPIYVVITMRSDFIGDCARFRDLPEAVTLGLYLIPRMSRDQRRQAIEEPVRVGSGAISRRLINRLLNDGGDDPDQLPSLQHALMRTWDHWRAHAQDGQPIDIEDYLAVGGMGEALSRHAEEAYNELPDERSRVIAKRLFQALTEKGPDNREVRRPTKLADIAAMADAGEAEVVAVVDYFRREGRSFLTPSPEVELHGDSVIDISHESLIRGWDRLKAWVEEEYESAKMYRRLAETSALYDENKAGLWHDPDLANALRWRANEKPTAAWARCYNPGFEQAMAFLDESRHARDKAAAERERNRRQKLRNARLFAGTVTALFLMAAGFAVYAYVKRGQATEAKVEADKNAKIARKNADDAKAAELQAYASKDQATKSQDMALGFAGSTVRGFSDLSDFIVGQHDVTDKFESLLKEAALVHDGVLKREPGNFPAAIMKVNAHAALLRMDILTARGKRAKEECSKQEAEAARLAESPDAVQRLIAAYLWAEAGWSRNKLHQKVATQRDMRTAARTADSIEVGQILKGDSNDQQALRCLSIVYSLAGSIESSYGDPKAGIPFSAKAVAVLAECDGGRKKCHLDESSRQALISDSNALASLQAKAGLKRAAAETYSQAIRRSKMWTGTNAGKVDFLDAVFWLYVGRGDAEAESKQFAGARKDYNEGKRIAGKGEERGTSNGQYDAAVAEERLGNLEHALADSEKTAAQKQADLQEALRRHKHALAMFKDMHSGKAKDPAVEFYIGTEEQNLAWDLFALRQPDEAQQHYEHGTPSLQLAADVNQNDDSFKALARNYRLLGAFEKQAGHLKEAMADYQKALQADEKIAVQDADSQHLLLQDTIGLGDSTFESQDSARARETYRKGIERAVQWTRSSSSQELFRDIVSLYIGSGDLERSEKAYLAADKNYTAAQDALKPVNTVGVDGKFTKSLVQERLAQLWDEEADAEPEGAAKNDYHQRSKTFREAVVKERGEIAAAAPNALAEKNLGIAERSLAWICVELKDYNSAQKHYVASADAYVKEYRLSPTAEAKQDLEAAYARLASVEADHGGELLKAGNYTEAQKYFEQSRATARQPELGGAEGRILRADVERYIGDYWREQKKEKDLTRRAENLRQALHADHDALQLRREAASKKPDPEYQLELGTAEANIALDYGYLDDEANSRKHREASRRAYDQTVQRLKPLAVSTSATAADRKRLADVLGGRSWDDLLLGDCWAALSDADEGFFIDNEEIFVEINKADAYLALGQVDAARKIYAANADKRLGSSTYRETILEDLDEMEHHPELKLDHKALASVREELKKAGSGRATAAATAKQSR